MNAPVTPSIPERFALDPPVLGDFAKIDFEHRRTVIPERKSLRIASCILGLQTNKNSVLCACDVHKAHHTALAKAHAETAKWHRKCAGNAKASSDDLVPTLVRSVAPDNKDAMQRLADRGMRLVRRDGAPTLEDVGVGTQAGLEAELQTVDAELQKLVSSE